MRNEQIGHSVFHTARTLCFSILNDEELQNVSLFALDFLLNYGMYFSNCMLLGMVTCDTNSTFYLICR